MRARMAKYLWAVHTGYGTARRLPPEDGGPARAANGPDTGRQGYRQVVEDRVGDRRDDERQEQRERLAADHDDRDRLALLGARPAPDRER